jgi:ferric-dicitrate binding protein FerR (iron transport regulator)
MACLLWAAASPADAGQSAVARVTFLRPQAYSAAAVQGPWQLLQQGDRVSPGTVLKTDAQGLLELTLPDGSVIRLGPDTQYQIESAAFAGKKRSGFSARLFFGRMWAKVSRLTSSAKGAFDVSIPTAVVGVRGTTYNIDANADKSAEISVFEGRVGVAPPLVEAGGPKEQISWPAQVSEQQWEEIILAKLQKLRIGRDGKPGKPQPIDLAKVDEWVRWNRERDSQR